MATGPVISAPVKTHSVLIGYILLLTCVLGAHRFYFGKRITGTIWFLTLTSLIAVFHVIGLVVMCFCMLIDALLIPHMARRVEERYQPGPYDYSVAWILLGFLGPLGLHRFYLGKILIGILFLLTGGLAGIGVAYDFWTLNGQVNARNREVMASI